MNYLPKGEAIVERDEKNRVIRVVAVWQGQKIPFVARGKQIVREDYFDPDKLIVPVGHYQRMLRQAISIFGENQTKAKSENLHWLLLGLGKCGVFLKGGGHLEITRWDKEAGRTPKLVRQKVKNIETAIRMQNHIIDGYSVGQPEIQGELAKIESIELVITEANQVLLNWRQTGANERRTLQKKLAGVVLRLENCRNEFKVEVRDQAATVVPLKDSLGRPNPMAFSARTIAALSSLTLRIKELNIIMPYIAMRKQLLVLAERWMKSKFKQTASVITIVSRHRVFRDGSIAPYEPKIITQKIDQAIALLNNAVISPHFELARRIQAELNPAKRLLQEKKYQACRLKLDFALELLTTAA